MLQGFSRVEPLEQTSPDSAVVETDGGFASREDQWLTVSPNFSIR